MALWSCSQSYCHIDQSQDVGCSWKEVWPWEKQVCSAKAIHKERWHLRADLATFPAASEISPLFLKGDLSIWILFQAQWEATEEFSEWGVVAWFTFSYDYSGCFLKNIECSCGIRETKYSICVKAKGSVRFAQCYFILITKSCKIGTNHGETLLFIFSDSSLIKELM